MTMKSMGSLFGVNRTVAISILVAVGLFLSLSLGLRPWRNVFTTTIGPGEEHQHSQSTGEKIFTLRPGAFYSFKFMVPSSHESASLQGRFSTKGSDGIETFVLNDEDFASWQRGYKVYRYYDSGKARQGTLDVPLLAQSEGIYHVVFRNSVAQPAENIHANLKLIYTVRWFPGMEE